jgi:hypothetical protein
MTLHPMKIEKGIPIPDGVRGPSKPWYLELEVGDSALLERRNQAIGALAGLRRNGRLGCSRAEGTGFRLWRIA